MSIRTNEQLRRARQKRRKTPKGYTDRFIERARLRTPDSDLDREFILSRLAKGICELTGVPFKWANETDYYHNPHAPSIDRIDPKRGYYKDNVQFVLAWVNRARGEFDLATFKKLLSEIKAELVDDKQ